VEIIRGLSNIKNKFRRPVVTIGTFDGVHIGHQEIIRSAVRDAKRIKGDCIVLTFDKRPKTVLTPGKEHELLMRLPDKINKIKELGPKAVIIVNFGRQIAGVTADKFVKNILHKKLQAKEIVIGSQFRFGKDRKGDVNDLKIRAKKYGYAVKVIKEKRYKNIVISSTKIRQLIKDGFLAMASHFLGHPYSISGYVVKGDQRGQTLGFPTANVQYDKHILVPRGVYAVYITVGKKRYKGICNIGTRPTFYKYLKAKETMEVHILGFKGNIYNKHISVTLVEKIRNEEIFRNSKVLICRIIKDIDIATRILSP
jgi:riboflavin kinase / FMN adenylyltransferase